MLKRSLNWKEAEYVFLLEVNSNKEYIYSNDNVAETSNNCYLREVSTLLKVKLKDRRVAGIQVLSLFKVKSPSSGGIHLIEMSVIGVSRVLTAYLYSSGRTKPEGIKTLRETLHSGSNHLRYMHE